MGLKVKSKHAGESYTMEDAAGFREVNASVVIVNAAGEPIAQFPRDDVTIIPTGATVEKDAPPPADPVADEVVAKGKATAAAAKAK